MRQGPEALGGVEIAGILEVLQFLQFLELLVVPDVRVIGRQAHEEVHQAEDDEERGDGGQEKHHLCLLCVVLAEELDLGTAADGLVLGSRRAREEEAWKSIFIKHSFFDFCA